MGSRCVVTVAFGMADADVALNLLEQRVPALHAPGARHEHVHGHEPARSPPGGCARRGTARRSPAWRARTSSSARRSAAASAGVEEPERGAPHEPYARSRRCSSATAIATSGSSRCQPVSPTRGDADEHARARPDVRHEVVPVRLERDRVRGAVPTRDEHARDARGSRARLRPRRRAPSADLLERARVHEPPGGRPDDPPGRDEDEHALGRAREVLGLAVAVGVLFVRRARGEGDA